MKQQKTLRYAFVGFTTIDRIEGKQYPGGAAAALAINASNQGINSHLISLLSNDHAGLWYKQLLDAHNITYAHSDMNSTTLPTCDISLTETRGSKRNWNDNGALQYQKNIHVPKTYIHSFDAVFFANCPPILGKHVTKKLSKRIAMYIPGPQIIKHPEYVLPEILQHTSLLFANEEEWPIIWNMNPFQFGVTLCIKTKGKHGSDVYTNQTSFESFPPPNIKEVIDVTGAGDNFALGFTIAHTQLQSIENAVRLGNTFAQEVLQRKGNAIAEYERQITIPNRNRT